MLGVFIILLLINQLIMKLELTRNANNKVVGYKLIKESTDDTYAVEYVRDMLFYGLDDAVIAYDGRKTDKKTGDTIELKWATKAHKREERNRLDIELEEMLKENRNSL